MPKVNVRHNQDGSVAHFVRFRLNGIQTSLVLPSKAAAEQFALDCEQRGAEWAWENYQDAEKIAAEMTLDEWATRYFDALTISPGSIDEYRRQWRLRWKPHLGHMKLSRITREDVVAAVKAQSGLAPRTLENAWGTLATMLKVAVADGHIDRSPALGVKLPTHESHESAEHRYMDAAELLQIIDDTAAHYRPLMWMLVGTGMRWSEATALTVGDVDLQAKTVRVTKAWKRDRANSEWYVGAPKTKKSRRTISLPNEVVAADVCAVLDIRNGRDALARLDDDEKGVGTTDTLGGRQQVSLISESGLYSLTLTSRKAEAKAFKRWITHDVLPAIRRTGSYGSPAGMSFEEMTAHVIGELTQRIEAAQERARELESPAAAWNALSKAEGDFTVTDAAKILGRDGKCPGPRQLFSWLEAKGWIFRRGGRWQVMQTTVNAGFMVERITSGYFDQNTGERKQGKPEVRVTAKGLERLRDLLADERGLVLIEGDIA